MTPEKANELRKPFDPKSVGKIPKGGIQLDYIGHANTTDRLLSVDPEWTYDFKATDEFGNPVLDSEGNLWISLTICGVTRPGVGDGRNMKERIGDAIRNGAMRFGVALDLWSKDELESNIEHPENKNVKQGEAAPKEATAPLAITTATAKKITDLLKVKGFTDKETAKLITEKLGQINFQQPLLMRLTEEQGTELYSKIVATKKEDLDMLVSMD